MKGQVTVDTLITAATIMALAVLLLTAFYGLYRTVETGIRKMHLKYLSRVIEDRMSICQYVENLKVYAPYDINVDCSHGKICWRNLCMPVSCNGGGEGKVFVIKHCRLVPQ